MEGKAPLEKQENLGGEGSLGKAACPEKNTKEVRWEPGAHPARGLRPETSPTASGRVRAGAREERGSCAGGPEKPPRHPDQLTLHPPGKAVQ